MVEAKDMGELYTATLVGRHSGLDARLDLATDPIAALVVVDPRHACVGIERIRPSRPPAMASL